MQEVIINALVAVGIKVLNGAISDQQIAEFGEKLAAGVEEKMDKVMGATSAEAIENTIQEKVDVLMASFNKRLDADDK